MVYSFSFLPGRTTHPYRVPTISYRLVSLFRVYACMYVWMDGWMDGCIHGCMYINFPFSFYFFAPLSLVWMQGCMDECMHACISISLPFLFLFICSCLSSSS